MMRTEVRRPLSPVERCYWIADQTSPVSGFADGCVQTLLRTIA
jgi:hypothetical protein